jgi:NADPH:quinone reductase-like Zn-dependent oxidoreductase
MPATDGVLAVEFDAYGGPEVLSLRRRAAPQPAPGEVLIEVRAASVNPVDWKVREGMLEQYFPITFPAITGRDGAGEIISSGSIADNSLIGKRVCFIAPRAMGTWSQKISLPASLTAPIPASLAYDQAAALPLAGISALGMIEAANVQAGMRVLVHAAAGGVGSLAVQMALARGATVIATCSRSNADFVHALGVQQVVAYDKMRFEDQISAVDVVFDVMGGNIHKRSYQVLKRGGTMICLNAEPYLDEGPRHGVKVIMSQVLEDPAAVAAVIALVAGGKIRPCVEHIVPLSDFRHVQQLSQGGHARGKTVVTM